MASAAVPLSKAQRADLATKAEKDAFRITYATKVGERTKFIENKRTPTIRRRAVTREVEELVGVG